MEELGYNAFFANFREDNGLIGFEVGRIVREHRERYIVRTKQGDMEGELLGNLRFSAQSRIDFPAVGDWVAISEYDEGKVLIHKVFSRQNVLKRKAVNKEGDVQVIAANIDYALVVQALDRDFSINRMERYFSICYDAQITPVVVLTKTDLLDSDQVADLKNEVLERVSDVEIITLSNETKEGIDVVDEIMVAGKTYCILGSSGVGKSSLINNLLGEEYMVTLDIGDKTNRGKHATTHRELILLKNGSIIIDTPGMREVGMMDGSEGIEATFEDIAELSETCRFADCTHVHEDGCAVLEALNNGDIDSGSYENYQKLVREQQHFEATVAEKRQKGKEFARMVKTIKKNHLK